jgi:cyclohexanone monooxygenase
LDPIHTKRNQYPGAACDVEAYAYMPLLEELNVIPTHKYAKGPEIIKHCERIVHKYGLHDSTVFQTAVTDCKWDAGMQRWVVLTDRGDRLLPRFVVTSTGPLNKPKLADIAGMQTFAGKSFHTSRWDYDLTGAAADGLPGLNGLRVGIIGTGATAVQVIPNLAKSAAHLYVFQRTPSSIDIRNDTPTDQEKWAEKNRTRPGHATQFREKYDRATSGGFLAKERRVGEGNAGGQGIDGSRTLEEKQRDAKEKAELLNFAMMERIRKRIDEIVIDPVTAEALKPYYDMGCKRPCFHDDYLPTFNRENVTLVHTDGRGVKEITPRGPVFGGVEYELDVLIYATGFETQSSFTSKAGFQVTGTDGTSLADKWGSKGIATLWGVHTHGFSNLFMVGGTQVGFPFNFVSLLDHQAAHVSDAIAAARARSGTIDVKREAEVEWVQTILSEVGGGVGGPASFLAECTVLKYCMHGTKILYAYCVHTVCILLIASLVWLARTALEPYAMSRVFPY